MPRKGLKVAVDLNIQAVTCPGTVLREREDVYLSVLFFGQQKRTLCLPPIFPLLFHQLIRFERTFPHCLDPAHLSYILADERILIELIQLDEDYSKDGMVLAFYETSGREFLYPEDSLAPSYTDSEREVLMQRTRWFSGISPKLEFCCSTTVSDVSMPTAVRYSELVHQLSDEDADDDIVTITPSRRPSRRRTKSYELSTISSRSKSPSPRMSSTDLQDRPPFILKRANSHNRALSPSRRRSSSPIRPMSAPPVSYSKVKTKVNTRRGRKNSNGPGVHISERDCKICRVYRKYVGKRYWGHKKYYHPHHHIATNGNLKSEADVWLRKQIARELSEDTEDLIESINNINVSSTSPDPIPGPSVQYGRLPYSPRSPRRSPRLRLSRSPSPYSPRSPRRSSPQLWLSRSPSPGLRLSRSPTRSLRSLSPSRARSVSPVLVKSSLRERYGDPVLSPRAADHIHNRVVRALDHDFEYSDVAYKSPARLPSSVDISSTRTPSEFRLPSSLDLGRTPSEFSSVYRSPALLPSESSSIIKSPRRLFKNSDSDVSSVTSEEALSELRSTLRNSGHSAALSRSLLDTTDRRYSYF